MKRYGSRTLFSSTCHAARIAVFASEEEASRARSALIGRGIDPKNISVSIDLTSDGIAAEAPGQAYANQGDAQGLWQLFKGGEVDRDAEEARVLADVERGSVVLTLDAFPRTKRNLVVEILEQHKAVVIRGVRGHAARGGWSLS